MAEEQETAQAQEEANDPRPGYIRIETGSTKHPDAAESEDGRVAATIGVFVGENLQEAVDKYGEDFVRDNFIRSVVVATQGKVRRELDSGVPINTVEDNLDDLDPTEQRASVTDPQAQAMKALQRMTPEQKAAFREMIGG